MDSFDRLKNRNGEIDIDNIKKIIPYKEPFIFLDKVLSLNSSRIVATKNFSGKEDFFKGHFVGFPILPGALTVEGIGQCATLLARFNIPNHEQKDILAHKLKDVRFLMPIIPPKQVRFEVDLIAQDDRGAIARGSAFVDDKLAAEAFLIMAIVSKEQFREKYNKNSPSKMENF